MAITRVLMTSRQEDGSEQMFQSKGRRLLRLCPAQSVEGEGGRGGESETYLIVATTIFALYARRGGASLSEAS